MGAGCAWGGRLRCGRRCRRSGSDLARVIGCGCLGMIKIGMIGSGGPPASTGGLRNAGFCNRSTKPTRRWVATEAKRAKVVWWRFASIIGAGILR